MSLPFGKPASIAKSSISRWTPRGLILRPIEFSNNASNSPFTLESLTGNHALIIFSERSVKRTNRSLSPLPPMTFADLS